METRRAAIHRKMPTSPRQLPITGSAHKAGNGRRPLPAATGTARSARARRAPSGWPTRQAELLPVPYFHVVFTLPAPIAEIAFHNKAAVYAILFRAAAETLRTIAADPKHLGAEIGVLAVLHTWGQNLHHHPHVHCVVPGGGLSLDGTRWVACRPGFFLPVRVLSRLFRRLFLERAAGGLRGRRPRLLRRPRRALPTRPPSRRHLAPAAPASSGSSTPSRPSAGPRRCSPISAATPIASPSPTAGWSASTDGQVTFRWKDYRHHGKPKVMTLAADEFIRRFLLHVLPDGFHRIRHYGFLANGHRARQARALPQLLARRRRRRRRHRPTIASAIDSSPASRSIPARAAAARCCARTSRRAPLDSPRPVRFDSS